MSLDEIIKWCEEAKKEYSNYNKLWLYSYHGSKCKLHLAGKRDINDKEIATREKMRKKEEAKQKEHYEYLKKKFDK